MGAPAQEEPRASAQVRILNEKFGGALPADDVAPAFDFFSRGKVGSAIPASPRPPRATQGPPPRARAPRTVRRRGAPAATARPRQQPLGRALARAAGHGGVWSKLPCSPAAAPPTTTRAGRRVGKFFRSPRLFASIGMRKTLFVVGLALTFTNADSAISRPALRARWSATDGFSDASFCSFNAARYQGMVDDEERTTMFAEAIRDALRRRPGAVVLVSLVLGSTAHPNPVTKAGLPAALVMPPALSHLLSGQAPLVISRLYLPWLCLVWLLLPWLCLPRAGHRHGPRGVAGPHRGACWREEGLCRGGAA